MFIQRRFEKTKIKIQLSHIFFSFRTACCILFRFSKWGLRLSGGAYKASQVHKLHGTYNTKDMVSTVQKIVTLLTSVNMHHNLSVYLYCKQTLISSLRCFNLASFPRGTPVHSVTSIRCAPRAAVSPLRTCHAGTRSENCRSAAVL